MTLSSVQIEKVTKLKESILNLNNEEKYYLANMMTFSEEEPYSSSIWDAIEYSQIEEEFTIDNSEFELSLALDLGKANVKLFPDSDGGCDDYEILNK